MNKCLRSLQAFRIQPVQPPTHGSLQRMDGTDNPMLQYPVLKTIFEVRILNTADLKNARLVCKEWAKASLDRWRQEATLTLTDDVPPSTDDDNSDSTSENRKLHGLTLSEFLEIVNMPGDPFQLLKTNFKKYKIKFRQGLCLSQPEKRIFWEKIGPLMSHLNISGFTKIASVEDLAGILFKDVPNLESLSYFSYFSLDKDELPYPRESNDVSIPWNWDERLRPMDFQILKKLTKLEIIMKTKCFPVSWIYFLARVPNIKELTLRSFPFLLNVRQDEEVTNELSVFFRSLRTIQETLGLNYFSQLSKLRIFGVRGDYELAEVSPMEILSPLQNLCLPLTALSFEISFRNSILLFPEILKLCSKTLVKLGVYLSRRRRKIPWDQEFLYGVDLPHLKELCLSDPTLKNLNFLRKLPNLRTLELNYCWFINEFNVGNFSSVVRSSRVWKNVVLPQMEELILREEICDRNTVEWLGRVMPNLKKLKMGLSNQGFAAVCNTWKHLETLVVQPNFVTESAILGTVWARKYSVPNITDLKELTSFAMGHPEPDSTSRGQLTQ
ncbi:unnamed protein product [Orchesella dallaii]|uniref:F-box domain-containing protein n=1 Tax=Orchesella dallaii TaxID=48710 RepID=A0ABP1RMQ1_9HEXA